MLQKRNLEGETHEGSRTVTLWEAETSQPVHGDLSGVDAAGEDTSRLFGGSDIDIQEWEPCGDRDDDGVPLPLYDEEPSLRKPSTR